LDNLKYAHSMKFRPREEWHRPEDHPSETTRLAGSFAAEFGAGEWGYLAGLWHDLGKYSNDFQKMLCDDNEETGRKKAVNHSTAGALLVIEKFGLVGRIFAYPIAGHHAVTCAVRS